MTERELFMSHLRELRAQLRALKAQLESPGAEFVDPGGPQSTSLDHHPERRERHQQNHDAMLYQFLEDEEDYI